MNYTFPTPTAALFTTLSQGRRSPVQPEGDMLAPRFATVGEDVTFFLPEDRYATIRTTNTHMCATAGIAEEQQGSLLLRFKPNQDLFDTNPPLVAQVDTTSIKDTYRTLRSVANLAPLINFCRTGHIDPPLARLCQAANSADILCKVLSGDLPNVTTVAMPIPQIGIVVEGEEVEFSYY